MPPSKVHYVDVSRTQCAQVCEALHDEPIRNPQSVASGRDGAAV